ISPAAITNIVPKLKTGVFYSIGGIMRKELVVSATLLLAASFSLPANASTVGFSFTGGGVSGTINLTYGPATDGKYPQAFEVTGISGTFSDSNNGLNIVNAPVGPLVAITHDAPEPTNLLAPLDFSRFPVATGLPPQNNGFLTYDNLYYPGGSPATASDYTIHGGFLDIYGLMFDVSNGRVVDLWSNGDFSGTGTGPIDYGAAVATHDMALDYVGGGVTATPEPSGLVLLGSGLLGMLVLRRRQTRQGS
ncbi:MAG: PEP-CTERM sorting domain-containing protein, partial [Bryobacteraceae bacterium]